MRTPSVILIFSVCFVLNCSASKQDDSNSSDVSVSTVNSPLPLNTTAPLSNRAKFNPNCTTELSCTNRCSETPEKDPYPDVRAHCHCDEACLLYQDCCADYVALCSAPRAATDTPPVMMKSQTFDCVKLSTDVGVNGVFMISTCAPDWKDGATRQKCLAGSQSENRSLTSSNIKEYIPVVDLVTSLHYRNIYCGLCNSVLPGLMWYWKLKIRCSTRPPVHLNSTQALDFLLKYCPIKNLEPHGDFDSLRTCLPMVSTCSVPGVTEHHEGCLKGPSGLMYTKLTLKNYKNYHCLLCNGLPINRSTCGPKTSGQIFTPKSFEIVMDFDRPSHQESKIITQEITTQCASDHVYDPHLEICRKGFAADPSNAIRDKYRVKVWMASTDDRKHSFSEDEFRVAMCAAFSFDQSQIDEVDVASEDGFTSVAFNLYAGKFQDTSPAKGEEGPLTPLDVDRLLNFNESFEIAISKVTWVVLRATQRQLSCVQSEEYGSHEFRIIPNGFAVIDSTQEHIPRNKYFVIQNRETGDTLFVCKSKFTVWCPFVLLPVEKSEFKLYPNKSLLHTTTRMLYKTGEYDLERDKAWICTNYTKVIDRNSSIHYNFSDLNNTVTIYRNRTMPNTVVVVKTESAVLRYCTIIGFTISILSLTITLLCHCSFQELRGPLPGRNLMSLCLALLLFQFTWLLGSGDTDKHVFCTVIAAILHFMILVSFTCTAVIAFDTRRTFSSKISKAPGRSLQQKRYLRFLVYSGLAWGAPFLFVVGCVLLDHYGVVFIGYGNEDACWLVNVDAKIVVFAIPVACVLIYNVAAFSHTVWVINSARKQTVRVKPSRQDQQAVFKIYVRLVTLMGFSWFFSFSAELIHKALLYPFVVFTTTQGVYIFVAFICKARVLKLVKDRLRKSRKGMQLSIQNTTSTDLRSTSPYAPYKPDSVTHM